MFFPTKHFARKAHVVQENYSFIGKVLTVRLPGRERIVEVSVKGPTESLQV